MDIQEEYWERVFQIWYTNNRPNPEKLQKLAPPTDTGNPPSITSIRHAVETYSWHLRADDMDAVAIQKVVPALIDKRAEMFRAQADEARQVKDKALEYLLEHGFDNSAAATNALFKAMDTERTVLGMSEMLERIGQMTPEQMQTRIQKLLRRKNEAMEGEIVEEDAENNKPAE